MAKYTAATGDAVTAKKYNAKTFKDIQIMSFFDKFTSDKGDSIVLRKRDLEKGKGDVINYYLNARITGDAKTENDGSLHNAEKSKSFHSDSVSLGVLKDAVKYDAELTKQRTAFDLPSEIESAINMHAAEQLDKLHFDAAYTSPSLYFSLQSGTETKGSTSPDSSVTSTDLLTPSILRYAKTWLMTGGARSQTPFEPVMIGGKPHFVILTHPDSIYDLKQDSEYMQAVREAERRGSENPIFSGAVAVIDGMIIHTSEHITVDTNGASSAPLTKSLVLGKNALTIAYGNKPFERLMYEYPYEEEIGVGYRFIVGVNKNVFNSADFACAQLVTARTNISGS